MATGALEYVGYFHEKDVYGHWNRSTSVLDSFSPSPPIKNRQNFCLSLFHLAWDWPSCGLRESLVLHLFSAPIKYGWCVPEPERETDAFCKRNPIIGTNVLQKKNLLNGTDVFGDQNEGDEPDWF